MERTRRGGQLCASTCLLPHAVIPDVHSAVFAFSRYYFYDNERIPTLYASANVETFIRLSKASLYSNIRLLTISSGRESSF